MAQLFTAIFVNSSYWFSNAICLVGGNSYNDELVGLNGILNFKLNPRSAPLAYT